MKKRCQEPFFFFVLAMFATDYQFAAGISVTFPFLRSTSKTAMIVPSSGRSPGMYAIQRAIVLRIVVPNVTKDFVLSSSSVNCDDAFNKSRTTCSTSAIRRFLAVDVISISKRRKDAPISKRIVNHTPLLSEYLQYLPVATGRH